MDGEEHINEAPLSEAENKSVENLGGSDPLDEEKKPEDGKSENEECDNSLPENEQCSEPVKKDLEVGLEVTETVVVLEEGVRETVHAENVSVSLKNEESSNGSIAIGRRGIFSFCEIYIIYIHYVCVFFDVLLGKPLDFALWKSLHMKLTTQNGKFLFCLCYFIL
jgi:hypothetical protein